MINILFELVKPHLHNPLIIVYFYSGPLRQETVRLVSCDVADLGTGYVDKPTPASPYLIIK